MTDEELIPKFEVGDKVIVHYRPCYEAPCWNCGDIPHSNVSERTLHGEITDIETETHCSHCGLPRPSKGWYGVQLLEPPFSSAGVPYTLLEKIDG